MLKLPSIDPVAIYLGPLQFPWVVLFYLAAFWLVARIGRRWAGRRADLALSPEEWISALIWCGFIALALNRFAARLNTSIFTVDNDPDLPIYVGILIVSLGSALVAGVRKRSWWPVADLLAFTAPVFLAAHYLGELLDQTGWGRPTGLPWGMLFSGADGGPRHPIPLYGLLMQGVVLFLALSCYAKKQRAPGAVFAWFLVGFGASESLFAPLRVQDTASLHLWIGLAALFFGGLLLISWQGKTGQQMPAPMAGKDLVLGASPSAPCSGRFHLPRKEMLAVSIIGGLVAISHLYKPAAEGYAVLAQTKFSDLQGTPQSFNQWRGNVVLLNFWATWCPPCRQEVPVFVAAQRQYAGQGLVVVGIALDKADSVRAFALQFQINYPLLLGGNVGNALAQRLGNRLGVVPYSVLLDRQGRIVSTQMGAINAVRLNSMVEPLLKQRSGHNHPDP